ncbi:MAG: GlsB/YeaQ/YmgE family stress response membrane protein [Spirosomataceae bacterium]
MSFIITLIVGGLAGFLADLVFKKFSFSLLVQIILGIAGAFVGRFIFDGEFQTMLGLPEVVSRIIEAFVGASVILLIISLYKKYVAKN